MAATGRRLGNCELMYFHLPPTGPGNANIAAWGMLRSTDPLPLPSTGEAVLAAALALLQRREPHLRTTFAPSGTRIHPAEGPLPAPVEASAGPLRCCSGGRSGGAPSSATAAKPTDIETAVEAELRAEQERLLHLPLLDNSRTRVPMAVRLLLPASDAADRSRGGLVVAASHLMLDLQGSVSLLQALAAAVDAVVAAGGAPGGQAAEAELGEQLPPTCGIAARIGLADLIPAERRGWWAFLFGGGLALLRDMGRLAPWNACLQWPRASPSQGCHVCYETLDEATTTTLRERARHEGATVTAALAAAMAFAHRRHVWAQPETLARLEEQLDKTTVPSKKADGDRTYLLPLHTTVDLRRHLPAPSGTRLPPTALGNYAGAISTAHQVRCPPPAAAELDPSPEEFWQLARSIRDTLQGELTSQRYIGAANFLELLPSCLVPRIISALVDNPINPVTIGNTGHVTALPHAAVRLATLGAAFHNFAPAAYLCAATYGGTMRLSVSASSLRPEDLNEAAQYSAGLLRKVL